MRLSRALVRPTAGWVSRRSVRGVLAGLVGVLVAVPLTVVALASPAAAADDEGGAFGPWQWRSHLPQGNPLTAVHFSDADTGTAVGRMGTILRTTDGGNSWVQQPNPVTEANDHHAFSDVWFDDTDPDFGVAVSHGGNGTTLRDDLFVFRTFDGGASWDEVRVPDTVGSLEAVSFADAENGYAVGRYRSELPDVGGTALVFRTSDGGATWQDVSPPDSPSGPFSNYQLSGVDAVSPQTVVAVGTTGTIVRSDDSGETWAVLANDFARPLPTSPNAQYLDVYFRNPDVGWVIGTRGRIWHTTNGGQSWSQQVGGGNSLRGVVFTDPDTGWIAVSDGTLLHTSDGGAVWQQREIFTGTALPLNAVSFPDPEVGVVVGAAGVILRTEDGGDTWVEQSHRPSSFDQLNAVATTPDTDTAMAVGNAGTVLRSEDAGLTWAALPYPGGEILEDVVLLDADTAIAVGGTGAASPGVTLRTTDGGLSWQRQDGLGSGRLRGITCPTATTCMAVSVLGGVVRTVDGGQSWQDVSPPADVFLPGRTTNLESVSCPQPDTCVVVGWGGGIIRTQDGGQSWQPLHTTNTPLYKDVHFTDANTGWIAGGEPGVFLHTSDGGDTWQEVPLVPAGGGFTDYESVSFADQNTGTVVGANGYVWRTEDGGVTWVEEQRRTIGWLNAVAHIDTDTVLVVGREGTILLRGAGGPVEPPPGASQEIIATVPDQPGEGSLIVSVDPDDRTVVLPPVELAGTGDRLAATGALRPVTVTDTRTADPGWDTTAQVSDFSSDEATFGGGFLGWTPQVASSSEGQQVSPGAPVTPGFPTGDGLSVPQTLASAPAGGGLGVAQLGAGLALHLPVETPPGTYTAVLTVTAI